MRLLTVVACLLASTSGWHAPPPTGRPAVRHTAATCSAMPPQQPQLLARRQVFAALSAALAFAAPATAGDGKQWLSGKPDPLRPTNSKEKPDGTKKDNKYISCLNDCVPRKQGPPGPSQLERADCLDACQVECCDTYEQCTYTIRK